MVGSGDGAIENLLPDVKFGRLWTPTSRALWIWSRHWSDVSSMYHNHSAILGYASISGSRARVLSHRSPKKKGPVPNIAP